MSSNNMGTEMIQYLVTNYVSVSTVVTVVQRGQVAYGLELGSRESYEKEVRNAVHYVNEDIF